MNTRVLGIAGIAGALCLFFIDLRHVLSGIPVTAETIDRLDALLYTLWCIGSIGIFWAMYRLAVTGTHPILRLAPFIAVLGFVVGAAFSLLQAVGVVGGDNPGQGVLWILVLLGTLITAILALVARRWLGWRKFMPLVCILALPLMGALSSVVGAISNLLFSVSWMLLGFAVLTSADMPIIAPHHTATERENKVAGSS